MDRVRRVVELNDRIASIYDGDGIYVAVLDSGIVNHPDFDNRIVAFRDFTSSSKNDNCYDDNGHGTHV